MVYKCNAIAAAMAAQTNTPSAFCKYEKKKQQPYLWITAQVYSVTVTISTNKILDGSLSITLDDDISRSHVISNRTCPDIWLHLSSEHLDIQKATVCQFFAIIRSWLTSADGWWMQVRIGLSSSCISASHTYDAGLNTAVECSNISGGRLQLTNTGFSLSQMVCTDIQI